MRKYTASVVTSVILGSASSCWATPETPEQVVARYHVEFSTRRWLALADFMHPDELTAFKKIFVSLFSDDNPRTRQVLIELYGSNAKLTRISKGTNSAFILPILAMLNEQLDSTGLRVTSQEVLGSVLEGDLCHVVYRWHSETSLLKQSQVEVRTLRRYGDTWRFVIPTNLAGTIPSVRKAVQQ